MATASTEGQPPSVQLTANEKFFRYFQHEVTDLQEQMARIEKHGTIGGERADAIDHCLSAISRLSGEVQDASSYIPAYDQRTYGDAIKALQNKLQEVRAAGVPRQKFSFKKGGPLFSATKNESAISLNDAAELAKKKRNYLSDALQDRSNTSSYVNTPADQLTPPVEKSLEDLQVQETENEDSGHKEGALLSPDAPRAVRQPSFSNSNSVNISKHDNVHIVLPTAASHATSSGTVSNVTRSVIDMSSPTAFGKPFASLTLKAISSSLIVCGHVSGAAHLTNIKDSVILVASGQFRMHESSNCDVYLLTTSRPIIEDCSSIRFAPLPRTYMTDGDLELENKWSSVDDFKWLRNEQSPHWSPLEPAKRIPDKIWKETVPGGHALSVEDILKAVNVPM